MADINETLANAVATRMMDQVANKAEQGMSESISEMSPGRLMFSETPVAARVHGDWAVLTGTKLDRFTTRDEAQVELARRLTQVTITQRGNGQEKAQFLQVAEQWSHGKSIENIMANMFADDDL